MIVLAVIRKKQEIWITVREMVLNTYDFIDTIVYRAIKAPIFSTWYISYSVLVIVIPSQLVAKSDSLEL